MENNDTPVVEEEEESKGGFFGKFIAFLLGLLMGIIAVVGALAGVGVWIASKPVKEVVSLVDKYVDDDLYKMLFDSETGYLNEDVVGDKTVKQFFQDAKTTLTLAKNDKNSANLLQSLDDISPEVGRNVDKAVNKAEKYGIELEKEVMMTQSYNELLEYVKTQTKATPVGSLLKGLGKKDEPMILALCYGEENVDYTYVDGVVTPIEGGMEPLTINDIMSENGMTNAIDRIPVDVVIKNVKTDATMRSIAYGIEHLHYEIKDGEVVMLQVHYVIDKNGKLCDILGDALDKEYVFDATANTVVTPDGATHYLKETVTEHGEIRYAAYKDEEKTTPVKYSKKKIGDLSEGSEAILNDIYLKDALNVDETSEKVLISLAYGKQDKDFEYDENGKIQIIAPARPKTIGELREKGGELIYDIPLSDIMDEDRTSGVNMYLLYGKKGIHYDIVGKDIVMLQKRIAVLGKVGYNEYGEPLSSKTTFDPAGTYVDEKGNEYKFDTSKPIDKVTTEKGEATVYYLTDTDGNPVKYESTTLGDFTGSSKLVSNLTKRLTLAEIFDAEKLSSNKFLRNLQNETIDNLPDAIDQLKVTQVYEEEIFEHDTKGNVIYENGQKKVVRKWWYLLHDATSCKPGTQGHESCGTSNKNCISDYAVKDLNTLISNMQTNVNAASVADLKADGMITGLEDGTLTTNIKPVEGYSVPGGKQTIGELTVTELLLYVNALIDG